MGRIGSRWPLATMVVCAFLVACTSTPAPASGAANEFLGPGASECPPTDPGVGQPCSKEDARCEYGGDFHPACNIQRICADGAWRNYTFNGVKDQACGAGAPTEPPNPPECPATLPSSDATCAAGPACNYDAKQCTCVSGHWSCSTGKQYCKAPRPRIGTPCKAGDECVIEIKGPCERFVLECGRENTWTGSKAICL
jgi:hypothetical protein